MISKIKRLMDNPQDFLIRISHLSIFNTLPDSVFLNMLYKIYTGKSLNLESPKTFNEKLQWLKLYDRNSFYTNLVDKYEVRKYIAETIGEEYLISLIGVWDKFDDIDFESLPEKFVLKCTHDSGGMVICTDKGKLDIELAKKKITKSLNRNYFFQCREWPYKNLTPKIICEKYMVDESGKELKDYKIFCFNGEPEVIQVDFNRFIEHKRNFYDKKWGLLPTAIRYPNDPKTLISKPKRLNDMLNLARVLAKNYPFVRIDFYSINSRLYFGEMTFYPEGGVGKFKPDNYDAIFGEWLELPTTKIR
ncbi:ATP-grasp fold amidoligase family protein [Bacillus mesophilum]|uniref:Glycosyl transferase n=1 Tax=Bacillus mesophilum TaxID=1071718 RepID=A0A7V7RLJ1_9BACI|nr:ATP-grasp fold amidoligase family protein [Bacillus mesophilum]KAB2332604.1 glycosyl transferase [Bacillus mesophilum]